MKSAAEHVKTVIADNVAITAQLTNGFYWELAPEATDVPFGTYRLEENPPTTKTYDGSYRVSVFVWHENLDNASDAADVIKAQVKNDTSLNWRFISSRSGYTDTDAREAFIEIVFTFNL